MLQRGGVREEIMTTTRNLAAARLTGVAGPGTYDRLSIVFDFAPNLGYAKSAHVLDSLRRMRVDQQQVTTLSRADLFPVRRG